MKGCVASTERGVSAVSRRRFLQIGGWAVAGLSLGPAACASKRKLAPSPVAASFAELEAPPFRVVEVSGSAYACGRAAGQQCAREVHLGLERRRAWFEELRGFMQADLARRYHPFLAAARQHCPEVVAELEGWADGAGVPFQDLFALNLKAELGAMMAARGETPGCSTIALCREDRHLLAHNEDGAADYADLMVLLDQRPQGKPGFVGLSYPGILPGNGPAVTAAGLVLCTNYIAALVLRPGIPRYVLDRAVLDCRDLDEAIGVATHTDRAFAHHFSLASLDARQIVSVEASAERHQIYAVDGLYVHTNHLVLGDTRGAAQDPGYVNGSSMSRYRVLASWQGDAEDRLGELDAPDLARALSSHTGAPYAPCRHPEGEVQGQTLACSIFDLERRVWTLIPGNPCLGSPSEARIG